MREEYLYEIERVRDILASAEYVVFLGGAGVSTDSGIPDFRGSDGLYNSADETNEYYLSRECLVNEPDKFFSFFRNNMWYPYAEPNEAHDALARLELNGIVKAIITQNVDGLHQKAGSKRVIELHGTTSRFYCVRCGKVYDSDCMLQGKDLPTCSKCGAIVRPDITLYGEPLDGYTYAEAEEEISNADVLIVGGSSLTVHPAASLIDVFQGEHLIIVNYLPTPYDGLAEFVIRDSISDVLSQLTEEM